MDPVSLIVSGMNNFEFERGFSEGKFGVSFYYGKTGNSTRVVGGYKIYNTEQAVAFSYYFKNFDKSSFWLGPRLSFTSSTIVDDKNPSNYANNIGTLGLSASLGYQFALGSFHLSPFFAFGYALTDNLWGKAVYHGNLKSNPIIINYGLKTGIAF